MDTASSSSCFLISVLLLVTLTANLAEAQKPPIVKGLSWSFYDKSCPKLQSIVRAHIKTVLKKDIGLAAGLLRLHFHDCFVQGCDGSVLLEGSAAGPGEQSVLPNLSLRKETFKIINDLRARVDKECRRLVSCSDLLALASRDSVVISGGPKFDVPLGRRDGMKLATPEETLANLPSPFSNTTVILSDFSKKSFNARETVALSGGGHTVGLAHCLAFAGRLSPTQDPTMDKTFAKNLKKACPTATSNNTANLDLRSPNVFDNKYFVNLVNQQGLLTSDQDLFTDKRTREIVKSFAGDQSAFFQEFASAMIKMSQLRVLTGNQGEIRANCSRRNSKSNNLGNFAYSAAEEVLSEIM